MRSCGIGLRKSFMGHYVVTVNFPGVGCNDCLFLKSFSYLLDLFRPWGGQPDVGEGARSCGSGPGGIGGSCYDIDAYSTHWYGVGCRRIVEGRAAGRTGGLGMSPSSRASRLGRPSTCGMFALMVFQCFTRLIARHPDGVNGLRGISTMTCLTQTYTHTRTGAALSDLAMRGR